MVTIRRADNSPFRIHTVTMSSTATRPLDISYETAGEETLSGIIDFDGLLPGGMITYHLDNGAGRLGQDVTSWTYQNPTAHAPFLHGFSGFYDNGVVDPPVTDVPEPAGLALMGAGLAGIGAAFHRRRRQEQQQPAPAMA